MKGVSTTFATQASTLGCLHCSRLIGGSHPLGHRKGPLGSVAQPGKPHGHQQQPCRKSSLSETVMACRVLLPCTGRCREGMPCIISTAVKLQRHVAGAERLFDEA